MTSRQTALPADAQRSSWAALGLRAVGLVLSLLLLQAGIAPSLAGAATAASGLLVSSSAKRSDASDLNGATLSGTVWAFVPTSRDVRKVEFYLDDPSAKDDPFRTDKDAPFDLAGSGGLDTRKLADGPHSVTAKIKLRSGTKFASAAFTVRNSSPGAPNPTLAPGLVVSRSADRSNPVELDGATVSGTIWAFTARTKSVRKVKFFIDDAAGTGTPVRTDKSAPFDLAGSAGLDTKTLANGAHTVTAAVSLDSGSTEVVTATMTVDNAVSSTPDPTPTPEPTPTPPPTPTPIPTPVPDGSAAVGFGQNATGGAGGAVVHVTTLADSGSGSLRSAAEAQGKATIVFDVAGTISLSSEIEVASDKTIDGGGKITLNREGLGVKGSRNVIIRGMRFVANGPNDSAPDAVSIGKSASDVLVTRNMFEGGGDNVGDGAVDIVSATNVTVSWNHFRNWNKSMLINGEGSDGKTVVSRPQVTVHHNYFEGTRQRNPKLRHGMVHAYNNYLRNWDSYGMGVEDGGQLDSQANIFEAGTDKRALRSGGIGGGEVGSARSTGDLLLNGAQVETRTPEKVFQPSYQVTVERADSALRDRIVAGVGLQALSTP